MNTILSICIPTYNRRDSLKQGLNQLIDGLGEYAIPIYVSDNGSIDGTETMVRDIMEKYPFLIYSRNECNKGADFNFEKVLKMSETEYAWLLGDDDIIHCEFIEEIIEALSRYQLDIMVVNGYGGKSVRVRDIASKFYEDRNLLLHDIGWHMQWMSCLIFSRKLIQEADFEKYKDTYLLQYGIIFDYLARKQHSLAYWNAHHIIEAAGPEFENDLNAGWSDKTFLIFTKSWYDVIQAFPAVYTQAAKDKCILDHGEKSGLFRTRSLIRLSLHGDYSIKILRQYRAYIKKCLKQNWAILFLIAMLPRVSSGIYMKVMKVYLRIKQEWQK